MRILREPFRSAIVCLLVSVTICCAQSEKSPILRSADLQADVAILREAYEGLHPGLYRYNTKAQMDAAFAELNDGLNHDETLQEAFLAFSEFAAKVRCGHTHANPFNQSKQVTQELFRGPTRLPFYFEWLDRRMIVTKDFSEQHMFPAGTQIITINAISTETILAKLMTIARADGANNSKRIAQLAVTGDSEYEAFDIYYPMFFPTQAKSYEFFIQRPGGPQVHVTAEALTFEQRIAPIKQREGARKGGSDILFESRQLSGGSMYIGMPTWALYDSKWDWKAWLKREGR